MIKEVHEYDTGDDFDDILNDMPKDKARVSITIDKEVLDDLQDYKKKNKIKELSPFINAVLKQWIKRKNEVKAK